MFTGIAINSSSVRRQYTHALAVNCGMLLIVRATDNYPGDTDLSRLTSTRDPDVILVDMENPEEALRCLKELQRHYPETPFILFGGTPAQNKTFHLYGVRHFLPFPPEQHTFITTLAQAIRAKHSEPLENLAVFVPAKAGSGSSTVAAGVAGSLAGALGRSVLCVDADLRCGPLAFMLDQTVRGCLQGALSGSYELDHFKWGNCVTSVAGVDFILSSGAIPSPFPEWSHYFALLRFCASRYDSMIFDLPELVNDSTEEVVRRARRVYVVATQEPVALKLAERRCNELQSWGVSEDRIRLVINRWNSRDTAEAEVCAIAAREVACKVPNDYQRARAVQRAELPVPATTPLGKALLSLAEEIAGPAEVVALQAHAPAHSGRLAGMWKSFVHRQAR